MISLCLLDLTADFHLLSLNLSVASLDFLCFGFYLVNVHLRRVLGNILLTQFFLQICNGVTHNIALASIIINSSLHVIHVFSKSLHTGFQFFDLTAAAKKVAVILKRTT